MFQTSSSAIVSVTLTFLQDNSYIYIYELSCKNVNVTLTMAEDDV